MSKKIRRIRQHDCRISRNSILELGAIVIGRDAHRYSLTNNNCICEVTDTRIKLEQPIEKLIEVTVLYHMIRNNDVYNRPAFTVDSKYFRLATTNEIRSAIALGNLWCKPKDKRAKRLFSRLSRG